METLKNSANIRDHPIASIENYAKIQYHRKCYQFLSMKKSLDRLQKQKIDIQQTLISNEEKIDAEMKTHQRNKRREGSTTILPKKCIFCEKSKKCKGMQSKEPLRLCIDQRATEAIISAATKQNDFSILSISDLIASEAHYHTTCYKKYTKADNEEQKHIPTDYQIAEKAALTMFGYFVFNLQNKPRVEKFSKAVNMIENEFKKRDIEINVSTKKNLRRKLESTFTNLAFINVEGRLYFYPKSSINLLQILSSSITNLKT